MAVAAVSSLGGWLMQLNSTIQDLGNNYIRAGAAYNDYPQRVVALQAIQGNLVKNLGTYGFSEDGLASFLQLIQGADTILQQEVAKLKKRKGRHSIWYSIRGTYFPAIVNSSIETAEGAYRRITDYLENKQKTDNGVKALAESQGPWLRISPDARYVPRSDLEEEIMSALDKPEPDGLTLGDKAQQHPRVVLLWGASGNGKSTLAREVSLKCQRERSKFAKVVFLDCGPGVTIPAKKIELLQMLGGGDFQPEIQDVNSKLTVHLRNPRLLVVLDDLFEPELLLNLQSLSASGIGPGAQYLLTAQREDTFLGLRPKSIPVGDLERSDAKKVMASHAGYEDQIIPGKWQTAADKIIDQTGTSPLMMTTLGVQIQKLGRHERECWKQVSKNVFRQAQDNNPSLHMHGVKYSKQILPTMTSVFDGLGEGQKHLFALMAMWRSPSISKYALRFLYITAVQQGSLGGGFLESTTALKATSFVVERVKGTLSMHSSMKAFIWEYHKHEIEVVRKLLEDRPMEDASQSPAVKDDVIENAWAQNSIRRAVVCLYIDAGSSIKAERKADSSSDSSSDPSSSTCIEATQASIDIKATTAEPLMQMLVPEDNPDNEVTESSAGWTEELSLCYNQVLLDFVNEDRLHHDSISKLLASESSILPVLTFLSNVRLLEDSFWETNAFEYDSSIPSSMLNILQDGSRAHHHASIMEALPQLSWRYEENSKAIASVPGMLSHLAESLANSQDPHLQASAAMGVSAFVYYENQTGDGMARRILQLPGLLRTLVYLLCKDEAPLVQNAVAHALCNLSYYSEVFYSHAIESGTKDRFVLWDGLLEGLTMSLTRDDVPALQEYSAHALGHLATRGMIRRMVNQLGLVDNLVKCLRKEQNPSLQSESAEALNRIFSKCGDNTVRLQLALWPGLLDGLANSLLISCDPSLQEKAATAIFYLVPDIDSECLRTLVMHGSLMGNLVKLLQECQSSGVQLEVARALLELIRTVRDDRMRAKIVNFRELLEGLTGLLLKGNNPALQVYAALSLHTIGGWDMHTIDKICDQSGSVINLEKLLGEAQNSDVQYSVNTLLQKLATKFIIDNKLGLLVAVAKSLLTAQTANIQEDILRTIYDMFHEYGSDNVVREQLSQALMLNCPEVVDRLVELLHAREKQDVSVDVSAAKILAHLMRSGVDNLRDRVASLPQLLEGLSSSLVRQGNVNPGSFATLLGELAVTKETRILEKLFNSANLVENLTTLLTRHYAVYCQVCAAKALFNLAGGQDQSWNWGLKRLEYLLERLSDALLQDQNAALRERVVLALTSLPEGELTDDSSTDEFAKEEAIKENGGPNRSRAWLIRQAFRKYFRCWGNTKDTAGACKESVVDSRVLLKDFIQRLTAS